MIITTRSKLSHALMQEAVDPRSTMPEKEALTIENRELAIEFLASAGDCIETALLKLKSERLSVALKIIDDELSMARQ